MDAEFLRTLGHMCAGQNRQLILLQDDLAGAILQSDEVFHSFEQALAAPARARGDTAVSSWSSLCASVKRSGGTALGLYYTRDGHMRVALNDTTNGEPGWRDWTVSYAPMPSESWKAWSDKTGRFFPQLEMAEFIEDRAGDFVTPEGAKMLEVAQHFDVARAGKFISGVRLQSGATQLTVEESHEAKGRMNIEIPSVVSLGMRVFEDLDAYKFDAYFRWRISEGKLTLGFKIIDRQKVLDAAVADVLARIKTDLGDLAPMFAVSELPKPTPAAQL